MTIQFSRKFQKLKRDPKSFIQDSFVFKILNKNNLDVMVVKNKYIQIKKHVKEKTVSVFKKKKQANKTSIFIAKKIDQKLLTCLERSVAGLDVNIKKGDYRLEGFEFVICNSQDIYKESLCLNSSNGLIIDTEYLDYPSSFESVFHKINVNHLKLSKNHLGLFNYYKDRSELTHKSKVKYGLTAGVYTDDIVQSSLELIENYFYKIEPSLIELIFKKLYRILGTDQRLESIAIKISSSLKKVVYPAHFMMHLSAFFTEAGDYARAIEMAKLARMKDKNAWEKHRYLALSKLLIAEKLTNEDWAKIDSELYDRLAYNGYLFRDYIRSKKISIVGNSPCELDSENGVDIDKKEVVIRFNGANTDYPYCKDYGSKTNVLVLNPRYYETGLTHEYSHSHLATQFHPS